VATVRGPLEEKRLGICKGQEGGGELGESRRDMGGGETKGDRNAEGVFNRRIAGGGQFFRLRKKRGKKGSNANTNHKQREGE